MSVKIKDRHISKQHCLYKTRELMDYILVLTCPREFDKDGKQICKPGLLGEGQPLQAFGLDIIKCGKGIHACCYEANKINLKDKDTLTRRNEYHNKAIEYCDSVFRQIDLYIFQYARNSNKKRRSFEHEDKVRHASFKYLKWNFYLTDFNHIIQIPFKKKIAHQRRKLKKMHALWLQGKVKTEKIQQPYQGWRAHIDKGTCFYIIQDMDNYFSSLFKGVEIK